MEERRLLLAVALSLLVLTAYSLLFPPAPQPQAPVQPTAATPGAAASAAPAEAPAQAEAAPADREPRSALLTGRTARSALARTVIEGCMALAIASIPVTRRPAGRDT